MEKENFLALFEGIKYRYYAEGGAKSTKGKSNEYHAEWNNDVNKNAVCFTVNGCEEAQGRDAVHTLNAFFLDIDYPKGINEWEKGSRLSQLYQDMEEKEFAPTVVVETKNGGHFYWILNPKIRHAEHSKNWNEILTVYESIEREIVSFFGGDKGAEDVARVLRVPGSTHWKDPAHPFEIRLWSKEIGEMYTFEQVQALFPIQQKHETQATQTTRGDFPSEIAQLLDEKYPRINRPSTQALLRTTGGHIPEGTRNASLHAVSTIVRDAGWSIDKALAYFTEYHGIVAERGISSARNTIRSAYAKGMVYGTNHPIIAPHVTQEERDTIKKICKEGYKEKKNNDIARYARFEHDIMEKFPYIRKEPNGRFFIYEDGVYKARTEEEMTSLVLDLMEEKELYDHKTRTKAKDKLACVTALISSVPFEADADGDILNVRNGLLNTRTGILSPHTPDYVSLSQLDIEYDPQVKCPRWERFIHEIMRGDADQGVLLQQFAGYCLTPETRYETALLCVGNGSNGKSLFGHIVRRLVGEANLSAMTYKSLEDKFSVAELHGKKLNVIDETSSSGNYYESETIKGIITGGIIDAEVKYQQEHRRFRSTAKLLFLLNHLPKVYDTSDGTYRRFLIVEFSQKFSDLDHEIASGAKMKDIKLEERLVSELPGILNWAIAGLALLRKEGMFLRMQKNIELLQQYRVDNSPVEMFIRDETEEDENGVVLLKDLYLRYVTYCRANGYREKASNTFAQEIRGRGGRIEEMGRDRESRTRILGIYGIRLLQAY